MENLGEGIKAERNNQEWAFGFNDPKKNSDDPDWRINIESTGANISVALSPQTKDAQNRILFGPESDQIENAPSPLFRNSICASCIYLRQIFSYNASDLAGAALPVEQVQEWLEAVRPYTFGAKPRP